MTAFKKVNPDDYPISTNVRTDGDDLLIDTVTLMRLLHISPRYLRRLRSRNGNIANFPVPIKIKGRNYWSLIKVRKWELIERLKQSAMTSPETE